MCVDPELDMLSAAQTLSAECTYDYDLLSWLPHLLSNIRSSTQHPTLYPNHKSFSKLFFTVDLVPQWFFISNNIIIIIIAGRIVSCPWISISPIILHRSFT